MEYSGVESSGWCSAGGCAGTTSDERGDNLMGVTVIAVGSGFRWLPAWFQFIRVGRKRNWGIEQDTLAGHWGKGAGLHSH